MMAPTPGQLVEITDVFDDALQMARTCDDIWVFGYGSLMWLPDFDYRLAVSARLYGWHRRFTCRSVKAWGTDDSPGLSAALHPGGSVLGVAFALAPEHSAQSLRALDRREAAYRQTLARCTLDNGRAISALTYVANFENGRFLDNPTLSDQIRHIRQGKGPKGTSLYYLESTVRCLDELGSGRTRTHDLLDGVRG